MKKALFVSYVFPPMTAVGGQRVVEFCRHISAHGWTPVVLTVKKGVNTSYDNSLLDDVSGIKIYRSRSYEPLLKRDMKESQLKESYQGGAGGSNDESISIFKRVKRFVRFMLTVPDFAILWIPFGILKGLRAIRKEKVDAIVSSSPPVSAHIIAAFLSRLTGVPLLIDFRDLWTLNHVYEQNNYPALIRKYDRIFERFVLRSADWIITASPGFTEQMKTGYNDLIQNRISTITNGFDYGAVDLEEEYSPENRGVMRFVYAGSLYSHFNPVFFLESFSAWIARENIDPATVAIDIFGHSDLDYGQFVNDLELRDIVRFHGFKRRNKLLSKLIKADCLLLFLGFEKSCSAVIPAKLFEYLASGTPILAVAPEGVTSNMIEVYQAGHTVSEPDKDLMIDSINRVYVDWKNNVKAGKRFRFIENIDRAHLTGKLAGILDSLGTADRAERLTELRHKVP